MSPPVDEPFRLERRRVPLSSARLRAEGSLTPMRVLTTAEFDRHRRPELDSAAIATSNGVHTAVRTAAGRGCVVEHGGLGERH